MSTVAAWGGKAGARVSQLGVFRSEWTKLRSVRSTRWALLVAVALSIGLAAIACSVVEARWPRMSLREHLRFQPLRISLVGVQLAQLAIGVLGVLVITAEYSTGMIRATLAAVPRRLPVLWAKAAVYAAVVFALMLPTVLVSFLVGQAILSGRHIEIAFSHPGVVRALFGAALYLTVIGVFGLGLGAIVRSTAGGIAAFAGILFVVPPLMNVLPQSWQDAADAYLPSNAGEAVFSLTGGAHTLSPWSGFAVLCGYAAASLAIAAALLLRRDA